MTLLLSVRLGELLLELTELPLEVLLERLLPLVLCFTGEWGRQTVSDGFAALESMPDWYQYTLGVIVAASFGVRSATKFFGGKK